ncbi:hypothetical protein [Actinoplanes sp. L3-i22]|uniref:hypothetical protein n=1 Tax=Actinoplanes sp. L3-i22 TaxID=2836373 RepID=UPI001C791D25|nr:hypothetical protein [Actinoplanes sp. L3-i22]BCY06334.1 hypothetical protein L3i22_014220 [Actinoplanes sp. L3-i22]
MSDETSPWAGVGPGGLITTSFMALALLAAGSAAGAILSAVNGAPAGVLGFGAAALLLAHLVGVGVITWWRPRRSAGPTGPDPVTFRYSRWSYYWPAATLLLITGALVLFGWGSLAAGDSIGIALAVISLTAVVLLGWSTVRMLSGAPGRLCLTPSGLVHHGPGFTHRLPWDSVAEIRPAAIGGSPMILVAPYSSAPVEITGRRSPALPDMAIRGMWLASDPVLVYRTLRHYQANPAHRAELSSGAALNRIHQRRLG